MTAADAPTGGSPLEHRGPHVLCADLASCAISDEDRHHLSRVLRLRDGDPLTLTDGAGSWRAAVFGPAIEPTSDCAFIDQPTPELTIGFAVVKSAKPSLIVQKLTELGIDRIRPFHAERSVAQWDASKAEKSQQRLERVVREALMQSKGVWLPTLTPVVSLDELISDEADAGRMVMRADFGGEALEALPEPERGTPGPVVLVGPEGGWTESERSAVHASVSLGTTVLRAETACISAGVLLTARRRAWAS